MHDESPASDVNWLGAVSQALRQNAGATSPSLAGTIPTELVEALRAARHIAVLTGAGISAESGIPTFRDAMTGLWAKFRPEELATREAFARDPHLVWDWYATRRELVARAAPNAGHLALAELERRVPRLTLITQNVDGLHQRARSTNVIELHGNITRVKCFNDDTIVEMWEETGDVPPRCPDCGGLLRPDVVWFGELLPKKGLAQSMEAASDCDLFLSVGTSGVVEPAASLPTVARKFGAIVAVINLDVVPYESPDLYKINGRAGTILPSLLRAAWPE